MRKVVRVLMATICVAFASWAFVACGGNNPEPKTALDVPVIASKVYNGETQTASVPENAGYTVTTNAGGTDVGEYPVVLTLTDPDKYEWNNPDEDDATRVTLRFGITVAANEITTISVGEKVVYGTALDPTATAKFGVPVFTYSTEENGTYSTKAPTVAGSYCLKATVAATENYDGATRTLAFTIEKAESRVTTKPSAKELFANGAPQQLVTAGIADGGTVVYATVDGEETEPSASLADAGKWSREIPSATAAGKYTVYYSVKGDENHTDSTIGKVVAEIKKNDNAISDLTVADVTYNGAPPAPGASVAHGTIEYSYSLAADGNFVAWSAIEKRAGVYYVKAMVAEDDTHKGATATASFTMNKAANAISAVTVENIHCNETPSPSATATDGVPIYKYAPERDGAYGDITEFKAETGTYYVKAYVAATDNYLAVESDPVSFTVTHNHVWTVGETEDVKQCVCGDVSETFEKTLASTAARRIDLCVGNDGALSESATSEISLAGISDYTTVSSVKFGDKTVAVSSENAADKKLTVQANGFGYAYGEQTVKITVNGSDEAAHEISVKLLLVTRVFADKDGLDSFGTIAKKCESGENSWGGYFELGNDIEYNGIWKSFISASDNTALGAYDGFKGVFDGKGYKINKLTVTWNSVSGVEGDGVGAFIGKLHKDGVLRNVAFTDARVGHSRSLLVFAGSGTIENIYVKYGIFGVNNYDEYNDSTLWGQTATMFSQSEGVGAKVRNVIVDVTDAVGISVAPNEKYSGSIIGLLKDVTVLSDVYAVGVPEAFDGNVVKKWGGAYEPGTNFFVYRSFVDMAADTSRDYSSFASLVWTVKQGGLPYYASIAIAAPALAVPGEIVKGTTGAVTLGANATVALDQAAIDAGIELSGNTISVPEDAANATHTVTATSVFDPALKTAASFDVVNKRVIKNLSSVTELDFNLDNDNPDLTSEKPITFDLTEAFAGDVTAAVYVGETKTADGVSIAKGKVTLNFAAKDCFGEKTVRFVFSSDGTDYEVAAPALFVTKTIKNHSTSGYGDNDLRAIKKISDLLDGGGYYRLGENIKLQWYWYGGDADYRIGVDKPFVGTIDGNGYSIDGLKLWSNTAGGFIQNLGEKGTVKNIAFTGVQLGMITSLIHTGSGSLENIYVKVGEMPAGYGEYIKDYRDDQTTIFGNRLQTNAFRVKNILVDYSGTHVGDYSDKVYAKLLGTFGKSATVKNVVATGIPTALGTIMTDTATVYLGFDDGTHNDVAFPATGWNETYWTVGENTVTWNTKT